MGLLTDQFLQVAAAGSATYMTGTGKAIGATSFTVNGATGLPTVTACVIAIRQVDAKGNEVANTYTEWLATLSGTTFSLGSTPTPLVGSDQVYPAGATTQVYVPLSSTRDNKLINALLQQHNQDGSHGNVTALSLSVSGASALQAVSGTSATWSGGVTATGKVSAGLIQVASGTTASGSTITPTTQVYTVTALAAAATIAAPSFTPWDGAPFIIRITDNGSSQTLTMGTGFTNNSGLAFPTATVAGKLLTLGGMYSSATSKFQILGIIQSS